PKNAPDDFLRQLVAKMKSSRDFAPPWNLKLPGPVLGKFLLYWKTDNDVDLDYHVRHSAPPKPGGERELGVLVSRLPTHPLDFHRPLWECHVIEGLEDDRWAMYTKMHHSLIDGVSGMRLLQRVLSADPNDTEMPPPWTVKPARRSETIAPTPEGALRSVQQSLKEQFSSVRQMASAIGKLTTRARSRGLTPPFGGPKSML